MASDRIPHLKTELDHYEKQIQGMEKALRLASPMDKERIKQNIRFIREEMQPFEAEYWQLIAQASQESPTPEPEAEVVVAEIVDAAQQVVQRPEAYPTELMQLVQRLLDKLNESEQDAAGKLGLAFSLFPPALSVTYEKDLQVRQWFRRLPKLQGLVRRLEAKN
jgi:hypothetical protein